MGHTAGPWIGQNTSGDQGLIYAEQGGQNVAVCYSTRDTDLITASPELYEACRAMLAEMAELGNVYKSYKLSFAIYQIERAIAKAEGRE